MKSGGWGWKGGILPRATCRFAQPVHCSFFAELSHHRLCILSRIPSRLQPTRAAAPSTHACHRLYRQSGVRTTHRSRRFPTPFPPGKAVLGPRVGRPPFQPLPMLKPCLDDIDALAALAAPAPDAPAPPRSPKAGPPGKRPTRNHHCFHVCVLLQAGRRKAGQAAQGGHDPFRVGRAWRQRRL